MLLAYRRNPVWVAQIPLDGFVKATPQGLPWLPAQLLINFRNIKGVSPVMTGAVWDESHQGRVGNRS